ncbi:ArdC family protein [Ferruginibacter albus]|uniref:ArdC family protein n=1 Tax=Ferruginibacter albus TaxID=2875540 RepID=UPI001CC404EA|nr:zincin-like metallopeptidase domain-containing protein [Ferruginibacter albus]UAY53189.1 ssDNA-binding domain-containing protein [Ferruginibacter albus]
MTKENVYETVTNKIISDLEKGQLTWRKPWNSGNLQNHIMRPMRSNDIPFTGINTILLWAAAAEKNYNSACWITFKQAQNLRANVRKGEKGTQIIYADKFEKELQLPNGQKEIEKIPFLKMYTVFNIEQIENLPASFLEVTEPKYFPNPEERMQDVEHFFAETKANIFTGAEAAYYPQMDRIAMPPFESFDNAISYYGTLAHEVAHWTGHASRLNREFHSRSSNKIGYAKEELIAELSACFLAAELGIEPKTEINHSAYIQSWLKHLKDDKKFIFQAATQAQKAVEFLNTLQPAAKTVSQKLTI